MLYPVDGMHYPIFEQLEPKEKGRLLAVYKYGKEPRKNETSLQRTNFACLSALRYLEVPL